MAEPALDGEQQLVVALVARMDKYERDMLRARNATNDNFKRMKDSAKRHTDDMERITGRTFDRLAGGIEKAFAPFMRGGVVLAGVGAAVTAVKEIADSIAEVDREARKAGVTAKVWQQWSYVATATGASIDGITDALKEMNIRANEFALTGKGSGAEWFVRLGYSAEEVGRKLKEPNRFLDELIGKIQKLDSAGQTRALDELFGGTGAEQLAKVLGLSVAEIQKLRSEAATFTDEQIAAAKKIDAEFDTMWRNFTVYAKQAAIESVGALEGLYKFLNGEYLPGFAGMKEAERKITDKVNSPEYQLEQLQKQRARILKQIADEEAGPDWFGKAQELRVLRGALSAVDDQISALTVEQKKLTESTDQSAAAFDNSATRAANFKTALAELKNLVPGLKAELDQLAQLDAIDAAFQKAAGSARTMGQVLNAANIAERAKTVARYGSHSNILDLIASVESGGDYNATLDHGRWTGGAQRLTAMTLNQILALGDRMRTPENRALYGDGQGSSALGRYQITGRTLRGLMREMGLTGDRLFDEATQDEMARTLLRRRGGDPASLRQEWEGLKNVDDASIRNAYGSTPTAAQGLAPTAAQERQTEVLKQQTDARNNLNRAIEEGLSRARFEQTLAGQTEQQKRVELQLFDMQAEAKRSGFALSDAEIQQMREKLSLTQQLDMQNRQTATSQQSLAQAGQFFGSQFTTALSGLLTGTTSLNQAVQGLLNSLIDATLQAALLGQGPLAGLFGMTGGGLFGAIFGFANGGYTGAGTKYQPAGVVHKGEFVMSKRATERLGVGNLERLHRAANTNLPGFADGGYVGPTYNPLKPQLRDFEMGTVQPASFEITNNIRVEGSAGTPEQNQDLAKRMAKELDATMRGVVVSEIQRQMRPGNLANRRGS